MDISEKQLKSIILAASYTLYAETMKATESHVMEPAEYFAKCEDNLVTSREFFRIGDVLG
ncbi:hypothetical protein LJC51_07505 [Lachnospiraceae bacterium OttesenSCG-928-J05]|nr:hypothetical protein [Lachnospiraceae bacterium OttesenSCG-928-J05]